MGTRRNLLINEKAGRRNDLSRNIYEIDSEWYNISMKSTIIRRALVNIDFASYISGFVDGEGCFCVSVNPRNTLRTKWEIRPSFSVSQNVDRSEVLYKMQEYFQCGTIRRDYSDKTLKYEVRSLKDLVIKVIPHFKQFPLQSSKQNSFQLFAKVCELMIIKNHLSQDSILEIAEMAKQINHGKRKYELKKI